MNLFCEQKDLHFLVFKYSRVLHYYEGLAPIPELQVYPSPGDEAKTESIRSRFQAMMEQETPGSPVSTLDSEWEYNFEDCQKFASDIKAMSESKAIQAILWIGDKIKLKAKMGALDAGKDWAAWKSIYQSSGEDFNLFSTDSPCKNEWLSTNCFLLQDVVGQNKAALF